jgi:hypothetical protein
MASKGGKVVKKTGGSLTGKLLPARLMQRVPGGGFVQEQLERIEQRALAELKRRMDEIDGSPAVSMVAVSVQTLQSAAREAPSALLRNLLSVASEHSQSQSLEESCIAILNSLVPDEARILAALSDGSRYPMIHVHATSGLGVAATPMLEYVSSVGRNAGVMSPELTPAYVRHLASWGLVETAPADDALRMQFELLETENAVRAVVARIEKNGERARIVRRMLLLSDLGKLMWNLCQVEPEGED